MSSAVIELHLPITDSTTNAVEALANAANLSQQLIKQAMFKGCVWHTRANHTQRLRRSKKPLKSGDEIHLYYNPDVLAQQVDDAILISEQQNFSVWYKPYGMLCQGSKWSDHTTINRFVESSLLPQRPAFIVHRLDRATTGLIVIAHSKSAARALSLAFEERQTAKIYQAVVHGEFSIPVADAAETPAPTLTINTPIDEKSAVSHVSFLAYDALKERSLVQIKIDTGRKHQIRKHLSNIGYPIVGDRLYGLAGDSEDLLLCAIYLKVPCPLTSQDKEFFLPEELMLKFNANT